MEGDPPFLFLFFSSWKESSPEVPELLLVRFEGMEREGRKRQGR